MTIRSLMSYALDCDKCGAQPDAVNLERGHGGLVTVLDMFRADGWTFGPRGDLCPECNGKGGGS